MEALIVDPETASESVSVSVVAAVADVLDRDPTTIEPLYHIIDLEALDALFPRRGTDSDVVDGQVTFSVEGCKVTVYATGRIEVVDGRRAEP